MSTCPIEEIQSLTLSIFIIQDADFAKAQTWTTNESSHCVDPFHILPKMTHNATMTIFLAWASHVPVASEAQFAFFLHFVLLILYLLTRVSSCSVLQFYLMRVSTPSMPNIINCRETAQAGSRIKSSVQDSRHFLCLSDIAAVRQ